MLNKKNLTIALITLSIITSLGIYGLLSTGFQGNIAKLEISEKQVKNVEVKKKRFEEIKVELTKEKTTLDGDITKLRDGLSTNTTTQTVTRPNCSPEEQLSVNEVDVFSLQMSNTANVFISDTSVLGITTQPVSNGQSYSITVGGAAGISSVTLPSASPIDVILVPGGVTAPGPATGVGAGGAAAPTSPLGADYVLVGYDGGRGQPGDFFGANYPYYFANGGDSVLGVGGPIAGGVGLPATGYGAGGGGASPTNPSNNAGGAGAPGIVIIEW